MIGIVDNLLPEIEQIEVSKFLEAKTWEFGWKSNRKLDVYSFLHKHYAGHRKTNSTDDPPYDCAAELSRNAPLLYKFWRLLSKGALAGHTLVRCYANGLAYGSDGTVHTDSKTENSFTSLYYPHFKWEPNWGGETIFFNSDKSDIIRSVYPKPNRLLIFDGRIPHRAAGVSRTCPVLRVTLMFKTEFGLLKKYEDFLTSLRTKEVKHSGRSLYDHLKGTHDILRGWKCPEHVCTAGLFHSIYGTEYFKHVSMPVTAREELQNLIGRDAEQLVYEFCTIPRKELQSKELQAIARANLEEQKRGK